ncbi:MAG: 30S ribosomal protein S16 [bacterium]
MLVIRLTRRGRRNDPSFRLVVTESSNPVKGKFLEELGFYNPKLKSKSFKQERILYWMSKGAKCSPTVNNLLISSDVIKGEKVKAWRPKKREGVAAGTPKADVSAEALAKAEKAPEAEPAAVAENNEPAVEPAQEEKKEESIEENEESVEPEQKE